MTSRYLTILLVILFFTTSCRTKKRITSSSDDMKTSFEKNSNQSATYQEAIAYYHLLSQRYNKIKAVPFGTTDSGFPLHEIIIDKDMVFDPGVSKSSGKAVLMINNAIHPGEPCGVDASMMLSRELLENQKWAELLNHTVVVIIPFYNISGGLNRGSHSRANQNGPEEYGFRGNAQNLDLNRDFIKADTKNAESFNKLFNKWDPDVFIDNHTSNGADYQYVITLIATQKDKLQKDISKYMTREMLPELYKGMKNDGYEMTPYVFSRETPDEGIAGFLDLPRYSSGYAALHHTISFMPETHMLKPFKDRVWSVLFFMKHMLTHMEEHHGEIIKVRNKGRKEYASAKKHDLNWTLDFDETDEIEFKGYEAGYKESKVTGQSRLYYDRDKPYAKKIPFYNTYKSTATIKKPKAYIIPQAYRKVIERLKWNNVVMERVESDTLIDVVQYKIDNYESRKSPYEGHYLHYNVDVTPEEKEMLIRKGDYVIYTGQDKDRYVIETLEPQAPDSFFAWNFMDGVLMSKEYFSSYVFEERAEELLKKDRSLRRAFEKKKDEDEAFSKDARAQLRFIYERSPHYEQQYMHYPIIRIE